MPEQAVHKKRLEKRSKGSRDEANSLHYLYANAVEQASNSPTRFSVHSFFRLIPIVLTYFPAIAYSTPLPTHKPQPAIPCSTVNAVGRMPFKWSVPNSGPFFIFKTKNTMTARLPNDAPPVSDLFSEHPRGSITKVITAADLWRTARHIILSVAFDSPFQK